MDWLLRNFFPFLLKNPEPGEHYWLVGHQETVLIHKVSAGLVFYTFETEQIFNLPLNTFKAVYRRIT
jgi:hypothetical protein